MEGGDSFTSGDLPEDPDGHAEDAGSAVPGWLPPEDRLWRHPSEIARHGLPGSSFSLFDAGSERSHRRRVRRASLAAGAAGVGAVAAAVAVTLVVVDATGSSSGLSAAPPPNVVTIATSSDTSSANVSPKVMELVRSLRPSLVGLEPVNAGAPRMTGVVLPGGTLVVTAASAVAGVAKLDVVTSDGKRHRGEVVGSDSHSGVAVVSTDGGLVPAPFADEPVGAGDFALVACLCAAESSSESTRAVTPPHAALSTVTQVGLSVVPDGGTSLVDAIEAEMPLGRAAWGGVLVDNHGRVIGVLDGLTTGDGAETVGVFVPAPLAEGVAEELAQTRHVNHGWLGVVCADGSPEGATVTRVMPGSPAAAAGVRVGDVVMAVGSHPVGSLAELQERLYTLPPGDSVQLSVARTSSNVVMTATLANSPGT